MWVGGLRRPIRPSFKILLFKFCFSFEFEHWRFCSMMVVLKFNFVLRCISIDQFKTFILQLKTEKSLLYFVESQVTLASKAMCENLKNYLRFFLSDIFPPDVWNLISSSLWLSISCLPWSCFNRSISRKRRYVVPRLCS